jgi:hypothetical protein
MHSRVDRAIEGHLYWELLGGALEAHSDDNVIARESWCAGFHFISLSR